VVEATAGAGTQLIKSSRKTKKQHNKRSLSRRNRASSKLRTKSDNPSNKVALRKSRSRNKLPLATAHTWWERMCSPELTEPGRAHQDVTTKD
jgi:hypothetical protein